MNTLSYRTSDENGLSFELLVDGQPLGELVGARGTQFPYWIVGDGLPTWLPRSTDATPGIHIVAVCSCGEYGCGHTQCRMVRTGDTVVLSEFDLDCSAEGRTMRFEFSASNYQSVVSEIVALACAKQTSG